MQRIFLPTAPLSHYFQQRSLAIQGPPLSIVHRSPIQEGRGSSSHAFVPVIGTLESRVAPLRPLVGESQEPKMWYCNMHVMTYLSL
jgi:hypothetical protein